MKLEGADKLLKGTPGGLDGVYAVASCENGRPLYKRQGSAAGRAFPAHCACARTFKYVICVWQIERCRSYGYGSVLAPALFWNISAMEKRNTSTFRQIHTRRRAHCAAFRCLQYAETACVLVQPPGCWSGSPVMQCRWQKL